MNVEKIMADLEAKHPGESEYLQAVREVLESIEEVYNQHPEFEKAKIVERMVEPERIFTFRVTWIDDKGEVQTNLGYRVQFNSAIGPYKGGLRFHKAVTPSMLKFLGFEQTFKNALTTLPMGGGKGGSDFDPVGKSDAEIMRFCQAFMLELRHNIGPDQDVPAGDVGVGGREIGFLNGMYQKLARQYHTGVLTGKGMTWGGSILRPEATGFGALYFVEHVLRTAGKDIKGKKVTLSGFGNVAWGAATKALELGAKVVAISGPDGVCEIPDGITPEMIDYMLEMRASNRNKVEDMATKFPEKAKFTAGKKAWSIPCDIALPCAFQNELSEDDAKELKANGCWCCCEVSNMGCQPGAIHFFQNNGVLFAPGKAVNAGGVATSGLEMTQNAAHLSWSAKEVDEKLHWIMENIHEQCVKFGTQADGTIDYVKGANIAGFMKVAPFIPLCLPPRRRLVSRRLVSRRLVSRLYPATAMPLLPSPGRLGIARLCLASVPGSLPLPRSVLQGTALHLQRPRLASPAPPPSSRLPAASRRSCRPPVGVLQGCALHLCPLFLIILDKLPLLLLQFLKLSLSLQLGIMTFYMNENEKLIKSIIEAIQEKKGRNIVHVDLTNIETAAAQGFVIATGNTPMQVAAVADSVREYVEKNAGQRPFNYDGYQNAQWVIIDYGNIFVHIFVPDFRDRYNLEQLWADARINEIPDLD